MDIKKAVIWSTINGVVHESLSEEERKVSSYMPLISTLFPGINYYSLSGYCRVMRELAKPALEKLFPEMIGIESEKIAKNETVEVETFLPSKGYEWQDSTEWNEKFKQLLSA